MNASFYDEHHEELSSRDGSAPRHDVERFRMARRRDVVRRKQPKQVNGFHRRRRKRFGM